MLARAHPAEVEGVHRAEQVRRLLDVVVDDERDRGGDLELVGLPPAPGKSLLQARTVELGVVVGGVVERQPAVPDLGGQGDVLGTLGGDVDRNAVAAADAGSTSAACPVR